MKHLSKFFLATLLLTVASVSWAACPEGTKQTYKGCEPTKSLTEVNAVYKMYEMEGPDGTSLPVHLRKRLEEGKDITEEEWREERLRQDRAALKDTILSTFIFEMCPDSTRQTNEGCELELDLLNAAREEVFALEIWGGEGQDLFTQLDEVLSTNPAAIKVMERLHKHKEEATEREIEKIVFEIKAKADNQKAHAQTAQVIKANQEAAAIVSKAQQLLSEATTPEEKAAAQQLIDAAQAVVKIRNPNELMAAKVTLSAAQASEILAVYEAKTEARAAEKAEILKNAKMTKAEKRAAKKAAADQAKHSKPAADATPSRWDTLSEVEKAEALTSSEGERPPNYQASEEETAKANESHVYDEDGIRVFDPPAPPTPPIEE